jgi:excisionase family DNA binding protein
MTASTLNPTDIKAAKALSRLFAQAKGRSTQVQIGTEQVTLPKNILRVMLEVTEQLANGKQVSVMPAESDLSSAETAELLNVSRPYVVRLLETGKLPFHMVGTHRRVRLEDALNYKNAQRQKSLAIMQELSKEAQELGLGY